MADYKIKLEKTLKGSLDSIPSPSLSVKIQIIGGKVYLRYLGKTLLVDVKKLFVFKSLLTTPSNVLPLRTPQANFPNHNLNFQVKVMGSNPGYLLKSFLLYY